MTTTKKKPVPAPKRAAPSAAPYVPTKFHIDKRARVILATNVGSDDDLLTTPAMAAWLGVSVQWLEIARHKGYGPPFERLGPRIIRYSRAKGKAWLDERSHRSTAEYRAEVEA
jgi:predicted DNA-binding transcriptional regulator AlpA